MKIELVLGAGSAHGLAHIGVIRALEERGHEIVAVHGCSMGALIGTAWAAGKLDVLEQMADAARLRDLARLVDLSLTSAGVLAGQRIGRLLEDLFAQTLLEELAVPTRIVATDMNTWEPVEFTSGPSIEAVRASIGVPGLFSPIVAGERVVADGTLVLPLPIPDVRRPEVDEVLAVSVLGPPADPLWDETQPITRRHAPKYVMSALTLAQHSIEVQIIRQHPDAIVLEIPVQSTSLSYHRSREIAASGRLVAREFLPAVGL
ncbi:hypothetical protein Bequi_02260 [Brachybacterium sp. JHP9]|uniref:PNPLA domain-containing protein n=1 Tax=Brachybacterium equifaecis TaxID=2910770 RepID=A0ABT0QYE2_9MICO|nr:patatin-like phospholipase family protein [Brachybacterium equifaecis]MCL6422223.1 hypothetical protein [Brachybacterium equifaecis]